MNTSTMADTELPNNTTAIPWVDNTPSLEAQVAILLWKVWPPCLLVLGNFGNIATVFVMRRIKDKNSSQHIILMSLAMSDLCLLYVSVLRQWLFHLFHVDMYNLHAIVCKVCCWLLYGSSTTSSWLLTCVTVQRTMAVTWPHKMRMFCTVRRTWIVIIAVTTVGCLINVHFLFGTGIQEGKCTFLSEDYENFASGIWPWVDLAIFSLFPTVCLLVCDVILSLTLYRAISAASETAQTVTSANAAQISIARRKTASRTTVMILALSCTFLVLTLPVCVYMIWEYYTYAVTAQEVTGQDIAIQSTDLWISTSLAFTLCILVWNTNSAINFLLYCFTGTKFRQEFLNWILCGAKTPSKASRFSTNERVGR